MPISYFPIFDSQDPDPYIPDWPGVSNPFLGPYEERRSKEYKQRTWRARFMLLSTWRKAGTWQATHSYSVGAFVRSGSYVYMAVEAGISDSSPPSWPTTEEETVEDGSVVWICYSNNQITAVLNFVDTKKGHVTSFYVWMPLVGDWVLATFPKDPVEFHPIAGGMTTAVYAEIKFREAF